MPSNTLACPHCHRKISVTLSTSAAVPSSRSSRKTRTSGDDPNELDLNDSPTYTFDTQDTPLSYTRTEDETKQHLDNWKATSGSASQSVEDRLAQLQKERDESEIDDTTSSDVAIEKTSSVFLTTTRKSEVHASKIRFTQGEKTIMQRFHYPINTLCVRFTSPVSGTIKFSKLSTLEPGKPIRVEPIDSIKLSKATFFDLQPYKSHFMAQRDGFGYLTIDMNAEGVGSVECTLEVNCTSDK